MKKILRVAGGLTFLGLVAFNYLDVDVHKAKIMDNKPNSGIEELSKDKNLLEVKLNDGSRMSFHKGSYKGEELEVGNEYYLTVNGWNLPYFNFHQNVLSAEEVSTKNGTPEKFKILKPMVGYRIPMEIGCRLGLEIKEGFNGPYLSVGYQDCK